VPAPVEAAPFEDEVAGRVDLTRLLAPLPRQQRACAALCWGLGFTSVEAGAALDLDPATVRTHLGRAAARLRPGDADLIGEPV
jgi:DNA-directed RNA polymerase specialized sigma24 family protein